MKEEGYTSVVGYVSTVDIDELAGLCIGFLAESQSMSPEDRTIAANLLGDAATVAESSSTEHERVRLLRIAEAAIGGIAMDDNSTIAALFHRHKTELLRHRRKATHEITESPSNDETAVVLPEQPETVIVSDAPALEAPTVVAPHSDSVIEEPTVIAPLVIEGPTVVTPHSDSAIEASANVTSNPGEEPQVRRRQRESNGRFSKKRSNGQ